MNKILLTISVLLVVWEFNWLYQTPTR